MSVDFRVRVARKYEEADDIVILDLVRDDQEPLPAYEAGAHIDVTTPSGAVRQYSLCGTRGEVQTYQIAVLREPQGRGGSASIHGEVEEGSALDVSMPRNHFGLGDAPVPSILLAAGIGITPIIAMADQLYADGREFILHYCSRSASKTAFLSRLRTCAYADKVHFHFSCEDGSRRLNIGSALAGVDPRASIYACGPNRFIEDVDTTARRMGWLSEQIRFEHFAGAVVDTSTDRGFDVVLARSQRVVRVTPSQSISQALADCGVNIETSCEQGVCGTCLTQVIEGEVEHRDLYLSPEEQAENKQMLVCCSRAKSARLVLDL